MNPTLAWDTGAANDVDPKKQLIRTRKCKYRMPSPREGCITGDTLALWRRFPSANCAITVARSWIA